MNNDYKTQEYLLLACNDLKAEEGNDNIQDYIQIMKLYINWDVLIKAKASSHSMGINAKRDSRHNSMSNRTTIVIVSLICKDVCHIYL